MKFMVNPSILLVDDDSFMLKLLGQHLAQFGLTSVAARTSGRSALGVLDGGALQPDLILLDLNMPEMDGIEFVRHLVDRQYRGSLVLVSGEDERMQLAATALIQAHHIQLLGHLHKPVEPAALKAVLATWQSTNYQATLTENKQYTAQELRAALDGNQLINHYQPKVSLLDGRMVGVETLVRWMHPQDGLVYPDQFIGLAETHGLIDDLTACVLRNALLQTHDWLHEGHLLKVSVNLSLDNLSTPAFADILSGTVASAGLHPADVVLEVTESRFKSDMRVPLEILVRLRLKRFHLSIDDFGTGHSSLVQLRDIPFGELKIDRSFVHGAHSNGTLSAIFAGNMRMARELGMVVVAEGVEDREDWEFLRHSGCDLAQGYFIARPMEASKLWTWYAQWLQRDDWTRTASHLDEP